MDLRVGSIVVNVFDLERMTAFWSRALDLQPGSGDTFRVLRGDRVNLSLQVAATPVTARDQMHLDLYTGDQTGEVSRLRDLGATFVRHNADPDDDFVLMRDPEGNAFCVCLVPG